MLWCETESAQFIHLQRARAWGLPCERLWTPLPPAQDLQLDRPGHQAAVARRAADPAVRLIVVDALNPAGLDRTDRQRLAGARLARWLSHLARDTHKPVLALHHTRARPSDRHVDRRHLAGPLPASHLRVSAAVILSLDAPDPARPRLKRLSVLKSSLAAPPPPLGCYAASAGGATCGDADAAGAQLRFCDPPHLPQAATMLDQAACLLRDLLAQGPLPATLVNQELAQSGISKRTAARAKAHLGIRSRLQDHIWYWHLSSPSEPALISRPQPNDGP